MIAGKPPLGTPLNLVHPLRCGLVGYWLMNESGGRVLVNSVSAITNGVLDDATMWRGPAVHYHGSAFPSTSHAQIPQHSSIRPPSSLTVITRVKSTQTSFFQPVRGARDGGNYGFTFVYNYPAAGQATFFTNAGGTDRQTTGAVASPAIGWHELAGTYDGTVQRFYVDGALAASMAVTGVLSYNATPLIFGALDVAGNQSYIGEQAHVALWNRALSAAEVRGFYSDPYALFRPSRLRSFAVGSLGSPYYFHHHVMGDHSL